MATVPQPWNDEVVRLDRIPQREFHSFSVRHRVYCVPVDEEEENRQNELHDILQSWYRVGRLIYPEDVDPDSVLDCGCGSGIWSEQLMDERDCYIVGVDIFLGGQFQHAAERWNLNAPFSQGQRELSRDRYDLINCRFLTSGIDRHRWPGLVQDLFNTLNHGGWLQMTEAYMNIQSDNGRRDEAPNIGRWWELYSTALERQGKDPRVGTTVVNASQRGWASLTTLMESTGFVRIQTDRPQLPIGEWPSDSNTREVGGRVLAICRQTLEALGCWACCHIHGMTAHDFDRLLDGCLREMSNSGLRLYIQLYLVWGQKPHRGSKDMPSIVATSRSSNEQSMAPPSTPRT